MGLDVQKDTVQTAILGSRRKEPVSSKCVPNNGTKIVKELAKYQGKGKAAQAAYEAGCLGYTLYRTLKEFGFNCRVIPPNKVFHGGEEAVKTDCRDAADIAWMLRREEGESIAVPAREDEAARDLFPSGFNTPPLWGVNTGGVGDLFPHKRNAFKVKSSIPRGSAAGIFYCGAGETYKENLKSMKQRLLKFLLRKGRNCESGRYWTGK